jgi:uncharacterized protein YdcH (DUF465 family)
VHYQCLEYCSSSDRRNHKIYKVETDTEPTFEDTLNELRMERVKLKDKIYHYLLQK